MGWADWVLGLYLLTLTMLLPHGAHKVWMLYSVRSLARSRPSQPTSWPRVTIQLPMFNERDVAVRLIETVGRIEYPRDRLQIQVLDDSTDETGRLVDDAAARLARAGIDISVHRRADRTGYKAGALSAGLASASGEFIAIFDADFVPPERFLWDTIRWFSAEVGMVQTRWGHLNATADWLTGVQATLLDGHFVIEHTARHRSGRWFNFNGTAGVWRRAAIEDAGGWQHDTITEDLDLSYRAQMKGWRFVYLEDVVASAELPASMAAFKSQQHRWAKGSIQTCRKLIAKVWRSDAPAATKMEATAHLTANFTYPVVLLLSLLLPWAGLARVTLSPGAWFTLDTLLLVAVVCPFLAFYGTAVRQSGHGVIRQRWKQLPLVLAVGVGLAVSQSRAVIEGLSGPAGEFVRTPKQGEKPHSTYRVGVHWIALVEAALAVYLFISAGIVLVYGSVFSVPFILMFALGYGAVGAKSIQERMTLQDRDGRHPGQSPKPPGLTPSAVRQGEQHQVAAHQGR